MMSLHPHDDGHANPGRAPAWPLFGPYLVSRMVNRLRRSQADPSRVVENVNKPKLPVAEGNAKLAKTGKPVRTTAVQPDWASIGPQGG